MRAAFLSDPVIPIRTIMRTPRKSTSSQRPGVMLKTACVNVIVEAEGTYFPLSTEPANRPESGYGMSF